MIYELHLNSRGRRSLLVFEDLPDDHAAGRVALSLMHEHASCDGVEVFRDGTFLFRQQELETLMIHRPGLRPRPRGLPQGARPCRPEEIKRG